MIPIKSRLTVVLLLLCSLSLGACKSLETDKTYNKPGLTLSFLRLYELNEDLEDFQIDHPVEISTEQVRNHLLSLYFQDISETDQKAYPVFTEDDAKKLAPGLKAALNRLEDDQYIYFGFQAEKGVTEGEILSSVDKIHWRLLRINGVDYSNHFLGMTKPTWRLVRRTSGQQIYKEKTGITKITRENWMIVDLNLPKIKRRPVAMAPRSGSASSSSGQKPASKQTTSSSRSHLQNKLKNLKELYENGLIDEQDYQKKKNEILNRNF